MAPSSSFDFGGLGGLSPISDDWGYSRGQPVDRVYIERFLSRHRHDIRGHVLEIGDDRYTCLFGGTRVTKSTVADVRADNAGAAVVADLTNAPHLPDDTFDCVILTQVLVLIRDVEAALRTVSRILKPGGCALMTVPGISQISTLPAEATTWSWSFYPDTLRSLLGRDFDRRKLVIESYGNVKTAIGFLAGLAQEDLVAADFEHNDSRYPLIVAARAVKPGPALPIPTHGRLAGQPAVSVLMPVFNASPYLAEAIESVRAQSFDGWELIVVDDGSTDDSHEIARGYAAREPERIRVFQHPDRANHGLSRTLNEALARACGGVVAFLDADDAWMPERLAHDMAVLQEDPTVAAVISNSLYWWMDDDWPAHVDGFAAPINCIWPPCAFLRSAWLRQRSSVPCITAFTVRTSVLRGIGGFDDTLPVAMDMKAIAEVSFRFPVYVAECCTTEYRRTRQSLWSRSVSDGTDAAARRRFLSWLRALIAEETRGDPMLSSEFIESLSHSSTAQLIGCTIVGEGSSPVPEAADGSPTLVGPSPAAWSALVQLEAGPYALRILGANRSGGSIFTVNISSDGIPLARVKSSLPAVAAFGEISIPFMVPPPVRDVNISIGQDTDSTTEVRAIEVRAKGWSYELPPLLPPG